MQRELPMFQSATSEPHGAHVPPTIAMGGPATGLAYELTADARYQRTERVRLEVPIIATDVTLTARLLNRAGQTLPITGGWF